MKAFKSCANCTKSRPIPFSNDVLCTAKGVVSTDFVCKRHKFIPNFKLAKKMNYKCIDCANFIIHEIKADSQQIFGLCRLFSARHYDGSKKRACSKFWMKYEVKQAVLTGIR